MKALNLIFVILIGFTFSVKAEMNEMLNAYNKITYDNNGNIQVSINISKIEMYNKWYSNGEYTSILDSLKSWNSDVLAQFLSAYYHVEISESNLSELKSKSQMFSKVLASKSNERNNNLTYFKR
jgi:hypothetical protein